ncbi:hypothetical protein TCAL_12287 [Tigriopus californicus]|uniref:C2H2-type domain-containing protein n=2 Tax=Tigriopus californicus TaxID=6832 RepID=A0A553N774_TIGCA|nr:hypothetical protein TCAL_12287 [Tigriopus californicus]|eukprot:TCALIF_12287-PA protein Name:"Similar to ZNF467 Zinc finger protein 467 (Homo sapiens)" AED:0.17 eAED:0.19 QI:0/-1/0/1/-1/1/1/0/390
MEISDSSSWLLRSPGESDRSFETFDTLYQNMIARYLGQVDFTLKVVDLRAMKHLRRKGKNQVNRQDQSDLANGSCRVFVAPEMDHGQSALRVGVIIALLHHNPTKCEASVPLNIESVICRGCQMVQEDIRAGCCHSSKCPSPPIGDPEIMCYICGLSCSSTTKLETHLVHDHQETGSFFPCLKCRKHFFLEKDWIAHHRNKHSSLANGFPCQCGREFVTQGQLNRHQRQVHEDHRPFPCSNCDLKFKLKEQWTKHQLVHESVKRHECSLCPKTFRTRSNLKQHLVRCKKAPNVKATRKGSSHEDQSAAPIHNLSNPSPTPPQVRSHVKKQARNEFVTVDNARYFIKYAQDADMTESERGRIDEIQNQASDGESILERIPILIITQSKLNH